MFVVYTTELVDSQSSRDINWRSVNVSNLSFSRRLVYGVVGSDAVYVLIYGLTTLVISQETGRRMVGRLQNESKRT